MNTTTLAWPQKIKPVFEQNTEIVEDCKVRIFLQSVQLFQLRCSLPSPV